MAIAEDEVEDEDDRAQHSPGNEVFPLEDCLHHFCYKSNQRVDRDVLSRMRYIQKDVRKGQEGNGKEGKLKLKGMGDA